MLIVGVVLMNIVVAVLLDEFISTVASEKAARAVEKRSALEEGMGAEIHEQPLDPVLETLMTFTTNEDLLSKIRDLYDRIDVDESGTVDLSELNDGFKRMKLSHAVTLSVEDFDELTMQGRWTTAGVPGGEVWVCMPTEPCDSQECYL
jgi:hypothetical protein